MAEQFPQGAAPQENKMGVLPIGRLLANMAVPMMISMLDRKSTRLNSSHSH